jgi:hypothetical protein
MEIPDTLQNHMTLTTRALLMDTAARPVLAKWKRDCLHHLSITLHGRVRSKTPPVGKEGMKTSTGLCLLAQCQAHCGMI